MYGSNEVKTDPPCLLRKLRGPAPGHPEVYKVNPDPRNVGVSASGSPWRDPVLDTLVMAGQNNPVVDLKRFFYYWVYFFIFF